VSEPYEATRIPLARPVLGPREEALVIEVIRSGMLSLGPMLGRFERDFEQRLGARHAIAVSSGTAALHLGVRAVGWGSGDRVLTSPLSFVASSNCLLYEDATPVFCDVDPVTLCLDPEVVADAVHDDIAGILPIHIFGHAADMGRLERLAEDHGLPLLEDAAQALGAVCADGLQVGARGNPAAFAFYANKQMTTGEGGVLMLADDAAAAIARSERNQGRTPGMKVMDHERIGFNYRLTDLAAAIGIGQLERFDEMAEARRRIATAYDERFAELGAADPADGDPDDLLLPARDRGDARRSWFVYILRLPRQIDRAAAIEALDRDGIDARPYLPCIHLHAPYRERFGTREGQFPVAEDFSRRALALPFFPGLSEPEINRVVTSVRGALGR
jgi:perosamine synthetase